MKKIKENKLEQRGFLKVEAMRGTIKEFNFVKVGASGEGATN